MRKAFPNYATNATQLGFKKSIFPSRHRLNNLQSGKGKGRGSGLFLLAAGDEEADEEEGG